jgi:exodeoxyribonuclease VII small subunit
LSRLEELSGVMKEGSLSLEEAVKNFEEGVKLARGLEKDLSRIERRVEILINNPETEEEKPELGLFSELEED